MTLQAILIFLTLWTVLGGVSLIVTGHVIKYSFDDLPPWPWLRRLVLVFYFPSMLLLFVILDACRCGEGGAPWYLPMMFRAFRRWMRFPTLRAVDVWH